MVAPMVDNSELPFRMMCRKYGAEAAYTPMLHSKILTKNEKYISMEFTTYKEDRLLFVQFCANDPDILLEAAQRVGPYCDYVDINLGERERERERDFGMKGSAMVRGKVLLSIAAVVCFACDVLVEKSQALWFNLPATGTKCVSEVIQRNVLVLADYMVVSRFADSRVPTLSVKLTSPYGNILHHEENVTYGQFAFTTSEAGEHQACLGVHASNQGIGEVNVTLYWRTGIATKDWDAVARKEKIQGVELELRKLEAAVAAILEHMTRLKFREAEIRTVSERTNSRVARFSIMSLGVCITASGLQLWSLKRFFQNNKLI